MLRGILDKSKMSQKYLFRSPGRDGIQGSIPDFHVDIRRQMQRNQRFLNRLGEAADHPARVTRRDAVFVLKKPSHEHDRGGSVLRCADAFAFQILRCANTGIGSHIDAGMAKDP